VSGGRVQLEAGGGIVELMVSGGRVELEKGGGKAEQ
jgi:hypothetical protein